MTDALRWPAEWEPHAATWFAWPHALETWPGKLDAALDEYVGIVAALHGRETLRVLVADEAMEDRARRRIAAAGVDTETGIDFLRVPTNDAWIRDYGPIFARDSEEQLVLLEFGFNAWGERYPPWNMDDAVPGRIAPALGLSHRKAGFVLEGGSIDGNGRGSVLTTESCLLNPNREPEASRSRELMEERLERWLGATNVLWLGEGIAGDDTDGHIDDLARFVDATTVVAAVSDDPTDPNFPALDENVRRLRGMRDQDGKPLGVVPLSMPPRHSVGGSVCPATYANFYLANGVALVPTFGAASDARALAVLREVLPDREVVGVACSTLVAGLGAIHCLTQQEPAESAIRSA